MRSVIVMLTLPIKRQWYDLIRSGEKREEYRAVTKRYETMFRNAASDSDTFTCRLRNGYSRTSPSLIVRCRYHIGCGHAEWGAEPGVEYFVLSILIVEEE